MTGSEDARRISNVRYTMALPPPWERIDENRDAFASAGTDRVTLIELLDDAWDQGVLDIYAPTAPVEGVLIPAAIAVRGLWIGDAPEDRLELLLGVAQSDPTSQAVDVANSVAIRQDLSRELEAPPAGLPAMVPASSGMMNVGAPLTYIERRIAYLVGVPGHQENWVSVLFTTVQSQLEGSTTIADELVNLFDAIMTTFLWVAEVDDDGEAVYEFADVGDGTGGH